MNDSWFRRSNGISSGSSSIGTQGLFGNGSFDAMPFNTDFSFFVNNKNNNKPSVKLLPLSNRRTSSLANNNLTPDSGSFFFNGTSSEDTFFPLDRGQKAFVASSEFAEPARTEITLQNVVGKEQLINFAMDRHGVKFLEIHYPTDANNDLHRAVFEKLTESMILFGGLCKNSNGNFIIQKLVEFATLDEQKVLLQRMVECGLAICAKINSPAASFKSQFRDKYGCRLVQQVIDRLSENSKAPCFNARLQLLHTLMSCVVRNCYRLSSNEFANYVVQYAIKSSGIMEMYRDMIIDKCLLRNLLSMSQDKYASHVIEGAFIFAPPSLLTEMMTEIFDGYVKDHGTNRDALDILLFHQYGNYVVQQMITICTSALMGKEERRLSPSDLGMYVAWYEQLL
ncbi:Protein CBG22348 [Caenorhabditis briggsae]|uniref:Protein CBG22348 n=1 Tax=Caenorhabditis briggsae TaxID=6238 RepID=A8Y273_CAEBR|nr:Protein CBG22348 [Caenorhabditis briggsae]CAP38965.1 Protein CBG22348 [Caenorhabditis briggsae]